MVEAAADAAGKLLVLMYILIDKANNILIKKAT